MLVHERSNEIFLKLAEQGIITVYDKIDADTVAHVRDRLAVAQAHRIRELQIFIQTEGGSISAGLDVHDMFRVAPVERRKGLVLGYAHSMGVVILQACEIREATRNARFLLHSVAFDERMSLTTLRSRQKINKLIASAELSQKDIETILAKRTKRSVREVRQVCTKDTEMTAQEALDFGLIDAIRE